MRIGIENIGPVQKVEIDLSCPLIVFTGLNGSGKTYVSYLIYAFYSMFAFSKDVLGWNDLLNDKDLKIKKELDIDLLSSILKNHVEIVNDMLPYIYNVKPNDKIIKNGKIVLLSSKGEMRKEIEEKEIVFTAEDVFTFHKQSGSLEYELKSIGGNTNDSNIVNMIILKSLLMNAIIEDMESSERSGMLTFNKELAIGRLNMHADNGHANSNYPMPIDLALKEINNLQAKYSLDSKYKFLADELEKELLKGHLYLSETKKNELVYRKTGIRKKIPFYLSSSGIKSVSSIIFFLRYCAMDCNLIIIDEPEISLHPKNQILFARALARIINAGIFLIINTHSDYIIREINNMIMLSSISKKEKVIKLGYKESEILSADQVNAYYFEFQDDGISVVGREVEVSKTGFSIDLIDDVINNQVTTSQNIYENIEG
jgi:predicted ATPase